MRHPPRKNAGRMDSHFRQQETWQGTGNRHKPFPWGPDHCNTPWRNPRDSTSRRQQSMGGSTWERTKRELTGAWRSDRSHLPQSQFPPLQDEGNDLEEDNGEQPLAEGSAHGRCSKHGPASSPSSPTSNTPVGAGESFRAKTCLYYLARSAVEYTVWVPGFLAILEAGSPHRGPGQDRFFLRHCSLTGRWPSSPRVLTPRSFQMHL